MNTKNYDAAQTALVKLNDQIKAEAKVDPRLKNAARRTVRLVEMLKIAQAKYAIVCNKKVPAKVAARKAKAAGKPAKKAKATKPSNVVKLPVKKAAA